MSDGAGHIQQSDGFVKPQAVHRILAAYLSTVWLLADVKAPLGVFEGIPIYVVLTPVILLILGRRAITAAVVITVVLFAYEILKNFQSDYQETTKAFFGIMAFAALLPTIYYSMAFVLRCPPKFVGAWLTITLLAMLAMILLSGVLGMAGLVHSKYKHYFLPIHSYSGFFSEPSHVAMAISPYLTMAVFDFKTYRRYLGTAGVIGLVTIVLVCSSTTEFAIIAFAAMAFIAKKASQGHFGTLIAASIAVVLAGAVLLSVHNIALRVIGILVPKNLTLLASQNAISVLVFFKGYEMARYALLHRPLGTAFLDMAALNSHAAASHLSPTMFHLNASDGSSILFKGICEFGYAFAIFILAAMVKCVVHIWRYDRRYAGALQDLFFLSIEFSILSLFIRSASYYEGETAFAITCIVFPTMPFILRRRRRTLLPPMGAQAPNPAGATPRG